MGTRETTPVIQQQFQPPEEQTMRACRRGFLRRAAALGAGAAGVAVVVAAGEKPAEADTPAAVHGWMIRFANGATQVEYADNANPNTWTTVAIGPGGYAEIEVPPHLPSGQRVVDAWYDPAANLQNFVNFGLIWVEPNRTSDGVTLQVGPAPGAQDGKPLTIRIHSLGAG